MKTFHGSSRHQTAGSVLLAALIVIAVLGIAIGSYLSLVSSQNRSVMRSMAWNQAVAALEAGVEEALSQLNRHGLSSMSANGWVSSGGWYQRSRSLEDGTGYVVRIEPVSPPVIVATGIVPDPIAGVQVTDDPGQVLAAAHNAGQFVRRTVRVTTRQDGLFGDGWNTDGQIDLRGNNISSDSFDSTSPLYSTGGRYDPLKRKANGDIATNSGLVNSLSVGNANVRGRVSTGPGGSVSIGPNGSVGDNLWVGSGTSGIQPGYSSDDMNVEFPPVVAPFTSGVIPANGTVGGTNYDLVIGAGDYMISSLSGKVCVTGTARLYVSASLAFSGKEFIYIEPSASLTLYCAAPSASFGGNGVVNTGGDPLAFAFYGTDTCTSVSFHGNAAFSGVLYAPNADCALGGGGSTTYDFVGSGVTKTLTMNGHFNFHYDESLANRGPSRGIIPISWNEMTPGYGLP